MSTFLAPIHKTMYSKIQKQNEINMELVRYYEIEDIYNNIKNEVGTLVEGELENIIDLGNIHGWLQKQIDIVEKSFSFIVESIIETGKTKGELINWFEQKGQSASIAMDGEEIFKIFSESFLDGMPCDRAVQPIELGENYAKWVQNIDVHGKYWNDNGETYNDLRCAWLKGLSENSEFKFKYDKGIYEVIK